jgi:hypothetical protein
MKTRTSKTNWIILFAITVLLSQPMTGYAQDHDEHHDRQEHRDAEHHDRDRDHDRDHDRHGKVIVRHDEYRDIVVKDRHYFYRGGAFYDRGPNGYFVVTPPIGASIDVLPGGYRVVRHNRIKYYVYGGIYYRFMPHDHAYVVVSAPF